MPYGCKKAQGKPFTYDSALSFLNGDIVKNIDNKSCIVHMNDECVSLKLYDTYIITYYKNDDIELNTGGYDTVATKDYMNTFVKSHPVESLRGTWVVQSPKTTLLHYFYDHMKIYADGTVSTEAVYLDTLRSKLARVELLNSIIETEKDAVAIIKNASTKVLKYLFRGGKDLRVIIAQHAPINFLPILVTKEVRNGELWKEYALSRLR
jgi:hypothetical protein